MKKKMFAVLMLLGLVGACRAEERALVLEGMRAGERCAVAFLDDAGRPSKCIAAAVDTVVRVLTPASTPDASAPVEASDHDASDPDATIDATAGDDR